MDGGDSAQIRFLKNNSRKPGDGHGGVIVRTFSPLVLINPHVKGVLAKPPLEAHLKKQTDIYSIYPYVWFPSFPTRLRSAQNNCRSSGSAPVHLQMTLRSVVCLFAVAHSSLNSISVFVFIRLLHICRRPACVPAVREVPGEN